MKCWLAHFYGVTECVQCFARIDCKAAQALNLSGSGQISSEPILPKDQGLQQREE